MADYRFHFFDRRTRERIDTLPVQQVQFGQTMNGVGEFSGRVPLGRDGLAGWRVREATMPERTMVCVQRDNALVWGGYVTPPRERQLGGPDVEINAREAPGLLERIFMPTVALFAADQVVMARFIAGGRDPWLELPPYPGDSGVVVQRAWSQWDFVPALQALTELSEAVGGVEFCQTIRWDTEGRPELLLRLGNPRLGSRDSGLVFEYNAEVPEASNVESGALAEAPGMATRTWVTSETDEGVRLAATSSRRDLEAAGYPVIEQHEPFDGVPTTALLKKSADALQAASSAPTLTASFVVIAREGFELGDFAVGDDVLVRVTDPWWPARPDGSPGLNAPMRIVGYQVRPDTAGVEKYEVTMADMTGWW